MSTTAVSFPNKYAGHCVDCKSRVEPNQGRCSKEGGKYVVRCEDAEKCAQLASTPVATQAAHASVDLTNIPEGVYAHEGRLYQVDHPEVGEWAGWTFVKRIDMVLRNGKVKKTKLAKAASARPGMGAKFFGIEATHDLAVIVADPLAAAKMVGQTTGICGRCSAALSDPVSVERGIGPVCWKHWNL